MRDLMSHQAFRGVLLALLGTVSFPAARATAQVFIGGPGTNSIRSLAFSPDGALLAGGGADGLLRIWDMRNNKVVRTFSDVSDAEGAIESISISADGKWIAAGSNDEKIFLWDAGDGKLRHTLKCPQAEFVSVVFSPTEPVLASRTMKRLDDEGDTYACQVTLWDPATGEPKRMLWQQNGYIDSIVFSPNGKTLAITIQEDKFSGIRLCEIATGKVVQSFKLSRGFPQSMAFSPDGKLLANGGGEAVAVLGGSITVGEISIWNVETGQRQHTLTGKDNGCFRSIAFSPDGKTLAGGSGGPIKEYQIGNLRGQKVVSELKLWDVASGKLLWNAQGELSDVTAVVFSPDGRTLASCDGENLKLSEPTTGGVREVLMTWSHRRRR